jgi:AI-2 transport protein TqsA
MTPSPRPSDRRVQTVCLLIVTLIVTGVALALLQPVLVPFVLALFLSQCLAPLILVLMGRAKLPRFLAVTLAVLLAAGVLTGIGFIVAASVANGSPKFESYQTSLNEMVRRATGSRVAHMLGLRADAPAVRQLVPSVQEIFYYVGNTFGQVAGVVKSGASVLLLMTFLLYGRRWDPGRSTDGTGAGTGLLAEIELRVQQYISVTVLISLLTGMLVGASLAALRVQFAAVFGLLAFLLTFIPNFGGVIATLLPVPIIVLDPHLPIWAKVCAVAIPAGWQVLIGSLIQPKMTGQSLDLHPVVILLSLLFFNMIWGVGGAFLAVPLTATIKIVFEKIPNTRPLAAALAGNLSPLTNTLDG